MTVCFRKQRLGFSTKKIHKDAKEVVIGDDVGAQKERTETTVDMRKAMAREGPVRIHSTC